MKICKHCGTENVIVDSRGAIYNICKECKSRKQSDKMSILQRGENNHNFGKKPSEEVCNKIRIANTGKINLKKRLTSEEFIEKHKILCMVEEFRELDENELEIGKSSFQFKCKKCNKWFTPLSYQVSNRSYELNNDRDGCYFYCSDECKNSCSLFDVNPNYVLNKYPEEHLTIKDSEYKIFRKEVLGRQLKEEDICFNHCELCNSESKLEVHHEKPQKTHPHLALDPDNGIILCRDCHMKHGHKDECSIINLKLKLCS